MSSLKSYKRGQVAVYLGLRRSNWMRHKYRNVMLWIEEEIFYARQVEMKLTLKEKKKNIIKEHRSKIANNLMEFLYKM